MAQPSDMQLKNGVVSSAQDQPREGTLRMSGPQSPRKRRIRVVVVDDCRVFLDAACEALAWRPELQIVGKMGSAMEVIAALPKLAPDLLLVDLCMPMVNGLELTRRVKSEPNPPKVIVTTFHDEDGTRASAIAAGADEFLSKHHFITGISGLIQQLFPDHRS